PSACMACSKDLMDRIGRSSFTHSLADALLAGPWNIECLKNALGSHNPELATLLPTLPDKVIARLPVRPPFQQLTLFLLADPATTRALDALPEPARLPLIRRAS